MKDGRTHLAHKASTRSIWTPVRSGSYVASADKATQQPWTRRCAKQAWRWRSWSGARPSCSRTRKPRVNVDGIEELVADKGYHSGAVVQRMKSYDVRSYIPEKRQKGQRQLGGQGRATTGGVPESAAGAKQLRQELTQTARRIGRAQLCPLHETGGLRRCHLRGRENILKRQLSTSEPST